MTINAPAGQWVEIHVIVLPAGKRAPQVPEDTRAVPLELRAKGFLRAAAALGDAVEVSTVAGRTLAGRLAAVNPAYDHGFGEPVAELLSIGPELRKILGSAS
ncbi:MAG: 2-amino-4-ketopentanoate thiolase [Alphaproteobacteria bacterium]|nr:2-amino-4-ketopentanoate thiolase [Alphaproteobacteria bacterium]